MTDFIITLSVIGFTTAIVATILGFIKTFLDKWHDKNY